MEQRQIGSTGVRVSVLGFGCAPVASRAGGGISERAIRLALDRGVTFFDTADMYGLGGSERTLGRVLRGRRDRVVIATKCGYTFSGRLKAVQWVKPLLRPLVTRLKGVKSAAAGVMMSQRSQNFDPAYIESCVHASLSRLGTDFIDLFFLHDPPMSVVERGEALAKLRDLRQAGKIRFIGVSSDPDVAERAIADPAGGVSAVQVSANLLEQAPLEHLLPIARSKGIGFIARQPFANGRLFRDESVRDALTAHGLAPDAPSLAALALRFLLRFEGVSSILPSMIRHEHLNANIESIGRGPLTDAERAFAASLRGGARGAGADGC